MITHDPEYLVKNLSSVFSYALQNVMAMLQRYARQTIPHKKEKQCGALNKMADNTKLVIFCFKISFNR
jgi:hypothetical protein